MRTYGREEVRRVGCPSCGAAPGENCQGTRGRVRVANHVERYRVRKDADLDMFGPGVNIQVDATGRVIRSW
jgi:hypothetical protein